MYCLFVLSGFALCLLFNQTYNIINNKGASFSTGFCWIYWDYYKDKELIPANNTTNTNDYGGYSPKVLYVEKKYANYKQELLQHLSIYQYEMCTAKANLYIESERAKECYFRPTIEMELMISRGIKLGAFILMHHLLSIILYCDLDTYSRKFSETFRKLQSHETLQSVKQRNRDFWWQSKSFKEAVELFGYNVLSNKYDGPFFTGLSCVLAIPQFLINLYAPTSTSVDIEVAANFADEYGMIIQFEVCFVLF